MKIKNLADFYQLMDETKAAREQIVAAYWQNQEVLDVSVLDRALHSLQNIAQVDGKYRLELNRERPILLDLDYEIRELEKDLYFLRHGEQKFLDYLQGLHADFASQLQQGQDWLCGIDFLNFLPTATALSIIIVVAIDPPCSLSTMRYFWHVSLRSEVEMRSF